MTKLNCEHGARLVAPVGKFVEEHQLPDVSVGGDLAGEVGLQGGEGAPQDPRQVGAGKGDRHVAPPTLTQSLGHTLPAGRDVNVEQLRAEL